MGHSLHLRSRIDLLNCLWEILEDHATRQNGISLPDFLYLVTYTSANVHKYDSVFARILNARAYLLPKRVKVKPFGMSLSLRGHKLVEVLQYAGVFGKPFKEVILGAVAGLDTAM